MPISRVCSHSGAIIFDLTPEEVQAKKNSQDIEFLKERVIALESQLSKQKGSKTKGSTSET